MKPGAIVTTRTPLPCNSTRRALAVVISAAWKRNTRRRRAARHAGHAGDGGSLPRPRWRIGATNG